MNGIINLRKPIGKTSADMVFYIKKALNTKKVGHMGTLDPAAEGVLPIAVGKACRLFDYLLEKQKTYVAIFKFGVLTDTLDRMGKVIENYDVVVTKEQILSVLPTLIGEQNQQSPLFSAKKIGGKKAYDLARKGIEFEPATKKITIYDLQLTKDLGNNLFEFEIVCSGGTYIRSIARDLAKKLDTIAIMQALNRTKVGVFTLENSLTIEQVREKVEFGEQVFFPLSEILSKFDRFDIPESYYEKLLNGIPYKAETKSESEQTYQVFCKDELIGIGKLENGELKIKTRLI